MTIKKSLSNFVFLFAALFFLQQCGLYKKTDSRQTPTNAMERAKLNVKEGRGISLGKVLKGKRGSNYEFSTSNPMWRASLDTLDFLPLSVVDYSGGLLITDWYSSNTNTNESLKITVRFLSNEVRTDSLKITVHQKKCSANSHCEVNILNSKIKQELVTSIIKRATILDKISTKK